MTQACHCRLLDMQRHAGSRREQAVEAAGLEAALSWSKGKAPPSKPGAGKPPAGAAYQPGAALTPEAIAANAAAQVDADAYCKQVQPGIVPSCDCCCTACGWLL